MPNVSVVIPVYKEKPDNYEIISFYQSIKILKKYKFSFVCPFSLDVSYYEKIFIEHGVNYIIERFDDQYFEGVKGYNSLMLSKEFYERFKIFKYILIYQLDAYVFRDELEYWCLLDYDYIGAPWFKGFNSEKNGNEFLGVGNGGFSLRKIDSFLSVFEKRIRSFNKLYIKSNLKRIKWRKKITWIIKKYFESEDSMAFWMQSFARDGGNEDVFWTLCLDEFGIHLKRPNVKQAVSFAFEQAPSFLFKLNNNLFPFGCHAWEKYEYEIFWHKYIK